MRYFIFLSTLLFATVSAAIAKEQVGARAATEAEIRNHLRGASQLKKGRDGFEYRAGNPVGYKIEAGKICVKRFGKPIECLDVNFDGLKLEAIDRRGNREFLN